MTTKPVPAPRWEPLTHTGALRSKLHRLGGRLLQARLVHFIVLSGVLFAWNWESRQQGRVDTTLELSRQDLEQRLQRVATAQGVTGRSGATTTIEHQYIEDAVLVAEARRLGLDRDDEIVQGRLVQKMLFLAEELGGASRPPTQTELERYFAAHRAEFRLPAQIGFQHVFAQSVDEAQRYLPEVQRWTEQHPGSLHLPPFGLPFAGPRRVVDDPKLIAHRFGAGFADALDAAPQHRWTGPVQSRFGAHLVRVNDRQPERQATFAEVRQQLPLHVLLERRGQAVRRYLSQLLQRYEVTLDGKPVSPHQPLERRSLRAAASGED